MNAPAISDLISGIPSSLGSYGPLVRQIEIALQSPQCSIDTIADMIEKDVDLTARLLRFANSAYFAVSSRLDSASEAISLLGIQQVHDLLAATVVVDRFAGIPQEYVSVQSFWQHSLATGIGAKLIAKHRELPKPEGYFICGLLHDIGRLVLLKQAPTYARMIFELQKKERILLRDAELRVLGYDHQNVAEALLKRWKYHPSIVLAVANHHQPAGAESNRLEASVIHVADHIVNAMRVGTSGENFVPPLNAQAWTLVNLELSSIEQIVHGIDQQFAAVEELFQLQKTGS